MRAFGEDWGEILRALPWWDTLPPDIRRDFLRLDPTHPTRAGLPGPAAQALVEAGLAVAVDEGGTTLVAAAAARPLLRALREMWRAGALEAATGGLSPDYVAEHFTAEELGRIRGASLPTYGWVDPEMVAREVSSAGWLRALLEMEDARAAKAWEEPRRLPGTPHRLAAVRVRETLRAMARALAERPEGVPLGRLPALVPDAAPDIVHAALAAGVRYLFLFPHLAAGETEVRVGLLPSLVERMAPPPPPPEPVTVAESFEAPVLVADLTVLMVEAATDPIPVRGSDGALFVRAQRALAERMAPLPDWVAEPLELRVDSDADDDEEPGGVDPQLAVRMARAASLAADLALVAVQKRGNRYVLTATPRGRKWIALGEGERVKQVLSAYRARPERNPPGGWYLGERCGPAAFFPVSVAFSVPQKVLDLRAALEKALLCLPAGEMVALSRFLKHEARTANPFAGPGTETMRRNVARTARISTDEQWDWLWAEMLRTFVLERLVLLGAAALGRTAGGELCFALRPPGRYLLGGTDDFAYAPAADAEVVVQPDFEVVFLAPAPRVEAEVGRFGERIGTGVGALFRLTRASVLRAAEQGMDAGAMVETLGRVSRAPVPANVARQVRGWVDAVRRVTLCPALLVECPDAETAARVRALAGKRAAELTPTVLRLDVAAKDRAALVRRLREKGIFVVGEE